MKYIEREEVTECSECKCLLKKTDAKEVYHVAMLGFTQYFCGKCKPPYDKIYENNNVIKYWKKGTFECDEKGNLLSVK